MIKTLQNIHPAIFVLVATLLEVSGDAIIRKCIYEYSGGVRIGLFIVSAILLFGYGFFLNLAPVEFGQVVGLYITMLFITFQVANYIAFQTLPTVPIMVGGTLVIAGGLIITFWKQ